MKVLKGLILFNLLAMVLLPLNSCKKDIEVPNQELEYLFGNWEWIRSAGGFANVTITPATQGYAQSIEYKRNGLFKNGKTTN